MNYRKEIKSIMKSLGKNGDVLSFELGMSHSYFRKCMSEKSAMSVLWIRCFVIAYNLGKNSKQDK